MTGSIQVKNKAYYVVLNFKDKDTGKRKLRWFPTGLDAKGNNKHRAQQMLEELKAQYSGRESIDLAAQMPFSECLEKWLKDKKSTIELSTWESYETYIMRNLLPYFEKQQVTLEKVKPQHIKAYYDFKMQGGRLDGKEG